MGTLTSVETGNLKMLTGILTKNCTLGSENAMLKAVIEVYSELLVTNCYSQISCSRHSKFVKIIPILIHSKISATTQKMKFSIKDVFSKCDQIRWKLRIWSHLQKKSLMENFVFCAVIYMYQTDFRTKHLSNFCSAR